MWGVKGNESYVFLGRSGLRRRDKPLESGIASTPRQRSRCKPLPAIQRMGHIRLNGGRTGSSRDELVIRRAEVFLENVAFAPVAQGIEHRFPKPGVARSNRAGGTSASPVTSRATYVCRG